MPQSRDGRYERAAPIRVHGGLRARTRRGTIGASWWSRRFVDLLERVCDRGRLGRGRAYARQGQVLSIDLEPGVVTAAVQGSRPRPYSVSVRIEAFTEERWRAVETAIAEQAVHRARLLAGQMPPEIEELFAALGLDLFPRELDMRCSCPDPGHPCKHLSAVLYLLAESFDDDPFLVLAWRGRSKDDLLGSLPPEAPSDIPFADRLHDFFTPSGPLRPPPPRPAVTPDLLLRLVPPPEGLAHPLGRAYRRFSEDVAQPPES
ncbi:SWIM zinc finger family protein [Nonomuraea longicatena]|uniref:SWIM-type domain-containing protein n=1 Tax=Nonomuraea longicatena TaxID=83682 RepID=A0ABN1NNV4_9ACTN